MDRVLPASIAINEGCTDNGEESRDQTEHHAGQKSNKPFNVGYSPFQTSSLADCFIASVPGDPGVLNDWTSRDLYTTSQTVRNHGRSLHANRHADY